MKSDVFREEKKQRGRLRCGHNRTVGPDNNEACRFEQVTDYLFVFTCAEFRSGIKAPSILERKSCSQILCDSLFAIKSGSLSC